MRLLGTLHLRPWGQLVSSAAWALSPGPCPALPPSLSSWVGVEPSETAALALRPPVSRALDPPARVPSSVRSHTGALQGLLPRGSRKLRLSVQCSGCWASGTHALAAFCAPGSQGCRGCREKELGMRPGCWEAPPHVPATLCPVLQSPFLIEGPRPAAFCSPPDFWTTGRFSVARGSFGHPCGSRPLDSCPSHAGF